MYCQENYTNSEFIFGINSELLMCRKFTLLFTTNFVGSLDIRASREVFPIEVRSPEISQKCHHPRIKSPLTTKSVFDNWILTISAHCIFPYVGLQPNPEYNVLFLLIQLSKASSYQFFQSSIAGDQPVLRADGGWSKPDDSGTHLKNWK